ncbi:MAG TPA: hypothetical protein DD626_03555 [Clostridiales bacterium]|nr:hypothetical protein [Clostridiales bacterium]
MADKIVEKVKKVAKKAAAKNAEIKAARNNASSVPKVNSGKLMLLVSIVPNNKAEFYTDLLQSSFEVNFQWTARARGTANAEMLSLSEWNDQTKTAIFSVIKQERAKEALATLENKFNTIRKGKGIAFTVPFSSMIGVAAYGFLSNNLKTVKGDNNER